MCQELFNLLKSGQFTDKTPTKTSLLSYVRSVRMKRMETATDIFNDYISALMGETEHVVSLSKSQEVEVMGEITNHPTIKKIPLTDYEIEKIRKWMKSGEKVDDRSDDTGKKVKITQNVAQDVYEALCDVLGLDRDVADIKEDWKEVKSASVLFDNHVREREKKVMRVMDYVIGQGGVRQCPEKMSELVSLVMEMDKDEKTYEEERKKLFDGSRKRRRDENSDSDD